ncbi:major facilitator superfamily domain-containing protein [Fusarium oxysporum Fo47]|uniref:major facilitator superfamily domain-containing protein n=1 Tax=Fusarium oxysporum Fo47 TaxID=660027 RepID=UPI002869C7D6|nr:major facilitator superfamily domain-containing protein [Fusarium oxysporum Fo47]QKD61749.2 major facilitator superfamily domain-containing protein [Fusarium oxysporum Fo47]
MNSTTPLFSSNRVSMRRRGTKKSLRTKIQIPLLCYARLMVTMAYFSIFPYVALMVEHDGSSRATDIGVYALTSIFWGTMADRFGGKTILIFSLLGTAISSLIFGFTSSHWQMALCRCFMGTVSGGDVVIRAMIGKQCMTETDATCGFSLFSFAGNIGMVSGLIIGHALVNHVSQYLTILKTVSFLEKYPFCLPGITIGAMSVTCAIVITLFVDDAQQKVNGVVDDTSSTNSLLPTWAFLCQLIESRGVGNTPSSFVNISLLGSAFTAVATLALYTDISQGGLEFPGHETTLYMICQSAFAACWLFLIYPALYRRFGTQNIISSSPTLFPFLFLSFSIMNAFVRPGSEAGFFIFRVVLGVMTTMGPAVYMVVTAVYVGLQEVSPSSRKLGLLNGVAEAASCLLRVIVLSIGILIHAFCNCHSVTVGYLNWFVLLLIGLSFFGLKCPTWTRLTRS